MVHNRERVDFLAAIDMACLPDWACFGGRLMNPILLVAALVPSVVLGALILKMDWFESEPRKTLAIVFGLGCLSCIPAGILEGIFQYALQAVALPAVVVSCRVPLL